MAVNGVLARRGVSQTRRWRRWVTLMRRWFKGRAAEPAWMIDTELDGLALEVFARLQRENHDAAVDDPQGYLFRLADEVANERQERARRHGLTEDKSLPDDIRIKAAALSNPAALGASRERFESVMRELPPCHREALILHSSQGLTCSQIAKRQGQSQQAVLQKLTRTYARLRLGGEVTEKRGDGVTE